MMPPPWTTAYLDIPFVDHGRDRAGCDCYGLVRLILAEQFGLELPELLVGYAHTQARSEIARLIDSTRPLLDFVRIDHPPSPSLNKEGVPDRAGVVPGDVVLIRQFGSACHLGVMVSSRLVLHTEAPAGPRFGYIDSHFLFPRIERFYRHVAV